jgi:hypothetical protein
MTHKCSILAGLLTILGLSSLHASDAVRNFWFNGAEINRYTLTQSRYGEQHPGHAEFIFVTEPFLTGQQVKQERGNAPSANVLKLNALRTFNTGIYSYRTMTSTFRPIDLTAYPHALKTTTSVQDWCGHAFQQINRTESGWRVELRSYFQAEGDQDFALAEAWLEDELWVLLRLDPQQLPTGDIPVVPGALYTRFAHNVIEAHTAVGALKTGKKHSTYSLRYPALQRALHIHFDSQFPHIIRSWEETSGGDTTKAVLSHRIMNSNYWSEHQPGDRVKRISLGLAPIAD